MDRVGKVSIIITLCQVRFIVCTGSLEMTMISVTSNTLLSLVTELSLTVKQRETHRDIIHYSQQSGCINSSVS